MSIKTVDLVKVFLSCFDEAGKIDRAKYLEEYIGPNLKYFNFIFGYCRGNDPVFSAGAAFDRLKTRFEADWAKYEKWQAEYYSVIDKIYSGTAGIFKKDMQFDYCIMIGFYNANGWTDIVDGKEIPVAALDCVVHPCIGIVLAHELVHVFHKSCAEIDEDNLLDVLFYEGLAVYLTKQLNPGYGDNVYLSNFSVKWYDSWVAWYGANKYRLLGIQEKAQCFVQGQYRDKEFPARIAYYAGFTMITDLVGKYGLEKIVRLDAGEIRRLVKDYFSSPADGKNENQPG